LEVWQLKEVLTERNDLDGQLFGRFQRCADILGQTPVQAANRESLSELLAVASGGVVFTTIQKFLPEKGEKMPFLSERRNIIVIADETHRSQYDLIDGLPRHMRDALPNASFIGLTPSLPPLGRASPNAAHCLCRSAPPPSSHRHAHREDGRKHAGGLRRWS
jgi:type I restriction enzyme R subunit